MTEEQIKERILERLQTALDVINDQDQLGITEDNTLVNRHFVCHEYSLVGISHPDQVMQEIIDETLEDITSDYDCYHVWHEGDLFLEKELSISELEQGYTFVCSDQFEAWKEKTFEGEKDFALFTWLVEQGQAGEFEVPDIASDYISCPAGEFLVYDDDEADEACEQYIDGIIDDMLHGVDETLQRYFNREQYLKDCLMDGRGHYLASYDGHEHGVTTPDGGFFIYRTN